MRKTLKFLHTLGAISYAGAAAAPLVLLLAVFNVVLGVWRPRGRRREALRTEAG